MTYIETIKRNNKRYYYLTKNIRTGINKWKKIRVFLGDKNPSKEQIKKAAEKIEKNLKKFKISSYLYLNEKQAELLEDLKIHFQKWKNNRPEKAIKDFEEDFNQNPRCLIIFEFEKKTRDLKHIIGSIANASFLGKIGVLVVSDEIYTRVMKLLDYIDFCEYVKKINQKIFRNIIIIKYSDLKRILSIR